jgi:hypothetical protein
VCIRECVWVWVWVRLWRCRWTFIGMGMCVYVVGVLIWVGLCIYVSVSICVYVCINMGADVGIIWVWVWVCMYDVVTCVRLLSFFISIVIFLPSLQRINRLELSFLKVTSNINKNGTSCISSIGEFEVKWVFEFTCCLVIKCFCIAVKKFLF